MQHNVEINIKSILNYAVIFLDMPIYSVHNPAEAEYEKKIFFIFQNSTALQKYPFFDPSEPEGRIQITAVQ